MQLRYVALLRGAPAGSLIGLEWIRYRVPVSVSVSPDAAITSLLADVIWRVVCGSRCFSFAHRQNRVLRMHVVLAVVSGARIRGGSPWCHDFAFRVCRVLEARVCSASE